MIAELRIDLGAIARNVDALATLVAPARVVPVIKSNAYGHGLVDVARVSMRWCAPVVRWAGAGGNWLRPGRGLFVEVIDH